MMFNELPENVQVQLRRDKEQYVSTRVNDSYTIHLYSADGKRYVYAHRHAIPSLYMNFGGGSYWTIEYGKVQFEGYKDPLGGRSYRWCDGKKFGSITKADGSVVTIPNRVDTKQEVLDIIRAIGKFDI